MFEEILNLLTSSPVLMVAAAVIGIVCLWLGWNFKGMGANRREAALKQELLTAKASVLQAESTVRSRDQQAEHIHVECKELKKNSAELHRTIDDKDKELRTTTRQVQNLTSELNVVKGVSKEADSMIMDGFDDEVADDTPVESPVAAQLKKMETAYEKLKGALIKRDDRIDELEVRLQSNSALSVDSVDDEKYATDENSDEMVELRQQINRRDETIEGLHTQVSDLRQEKEMLEEIASRRSKTNRALKDASAEIKEQVPALQQEIKEHENAIADREASISRLLSELQTAEGEVTRQQGQVQGLQAQAEASSVELASKQDRVGQLESSLNQHEQQITGLNEALSETQQSVLSAEKQLETSKRLAQDQDEQMQLATSKLLAAEQTKDRLETDIDKRDQKLVRLTTEIEKLNGSLGSAQAQISESVELSDKHMASVSDDLADAQRQIVRLKSEIEDQSANLTQQMQWMSKLKETMSERESRNSELQEKVEVLNAQLEASDGDFKTEQAARRAVEAEKSATERKAVENREKVEEAEAIMTEQRLSNSVYTNIIADRDSKIEALKNDLKQHRSVGNDEAEAGQAAEIVVAPTQATVAQAISIFPIGGRRGFTRSHLLPRSRVQSLKVLRKSSPRVRSRNGQSRRAPRSVMRG